MGLAQAVVRLPKSPVAQEHARRRSARRQRKIYLEELRACLVHSGLESSIASARPSPVSAQGRKRTASDVPVWAHHQPAASAQLHT
eukprot:784857-Alexandrium_andersonii.AAC.1